MRYDPKKKKTWWKKIFDGEKKGVWGAFLGVFVDRIVRFGAIAESDGVILEKWTKFY